MDVGAITDKGAFEGFVLVREADVRVAQNGRTFLDLVVADRSASVPAKIWEWDSSVTPPAPGTIIKVRGVGNAFNGRLQLRVDRWRPVEVVDAVGMEDVVPSAPEDPRQMLKTVLETVAGFANVDLQKIVGELLREANAGERLLTAPAAKQLHHAERGGLLHHVTDMLRVARALTGVYPHLNADLLYAGVIVHDLGKLGEMTCDETGLATGYSTEGRLVGHIVRGAMDVERAAERVGARREQAMLLQHLVLAHHGKLEFGSPVLPKLPEAEVLSLLDVLDARVYEMRDALANVGPGTFSAKVWAMDNRELYQPADAAPSESAIS